MTRPATEARPPAGRDRRGLVPDFASRSIWTAAVWTGAAAAATGLALAMIAAAALWLPVSGSNGSVGAAFRAGAITYLAGLHGGVVVDATAAQFVPLGLTLIVAAVGYRFAVGLADVVTELEDDEPARLAVAVLAQTVGFTLVTVAAVGIGRLGTSHASPVGALIGAVLLSGLTGTVALARHTTLGDALSERVGPTLRSSGRAAGAVIAVYLAAGALLATGSLLAHHDQAETISRAVGGGLSGVPVLLLGVLTVPNVVVGAVGYLTGPGVAIGAGTHVGLGGGGHGLLPAFPPLAVVPTGTGVPVAGWVFAVVTPFVAAAVLRRVVARTAARTLAGLGLAALGLAVLAALAGGGVGTGRLHVVGVSPWQLALAVTLEVGVAAGLLAAGAWMRAAWAGRDERGEDLGPQRGTAVRRSGARASAAADTDASVTAPTAPAATDDNPGSTRPDVDPDGRDELAS